MNSIFSRKEKLYLFLILTLSFLIKIILAFAVHTDLRSDSVTYNSLALSILSGQYSLYGRPTALIVCGYPLFLSSIYYVFGEGQFYVKIIQSILEIFTGFLFFKISLNFFNVKYSLLSLAIFCFFPSNLLYSQTILTEPLFEFFLCLILYFCLRDDLLKKIFFVGVLFGCAIMIRSSFFFTLILVPLFLYIYRKKLFENDQLLKFFKYSVIFFIGLLLVLLPWIVRNKIVMQSFLLTTQGGGALWEGNNPNATGTWNKEAADKILLLDHPDEVQSEKKLYRLAMDYVVSNPFQFLFLGVKKIGYLFSSERMIILYFVNSPPGVTSTEVYKSVNPIFLLFVNIPYFVIMLLGTWGLLLLKQKRFFIYGFILTWIITIFIFVALARYHYILIPFFVIGTVNLIIERKSFFNKLRLNQKLIGIGFSIFLICVWVSELYLLLTK